MSEVEKMYSNAGISKIGNRRCTTVEYLDCMDKCASCDKYAISYPPFTARKQIELIKWISNNDKDKNKELTLYNSAHPYYYFGLHHEPAHSEDDMWGYGEGLGTTFEDGLASIINNLWQSLTEEERTQIKEILE